MRTTSKLISSNKIDNSIGIVFFKVKMIILLLLIGYNSFAQQLGQNNITKVEQMPKLPSPFKMLNWYEKTREYVDFTTDFAATGEYLPLGFWDNGNHNIDFTTFSMQTYIGTPGFIENPSGKQEALTCMSNILSGTLVDLDMTNYKGVNWVKMTRTFFQKDNGLNIYLNNTYGGTGNSFWYEIYPGIIATGLASYYPNEPELLNNLYAQADKWYNATYYLGGNVSNINFKYRSYDHLTKQPVTGTWSEPDAAAGIAAISYWAYKKWGAPQHLRAARWSMDWYSGLNYNPFYEICAAWGPYTAARMNAELGTNYDVTKVLNWCFDDGVVRNWHAEIGTWGGNDISGLIGDANNYAFAMNGWSMAAALAPVARYDQRYARAIGKWMLNMANASRLFIRSENDASHQSSYSWYGKDHPVPYEAIQDTYNGVSPYAKGDAIPGGWAKTDLSLYSGGHMGFLGGIFKPTNNSSIFQINCNKTDFFSEAYYPTFLYYNPNNSGSWVNIDLGTGLFDLYDVISNSIIRNDVSGTTNFWIPSDYAKLIVVIPNTAQLVQDGRYINAVVGNDVRRVRWQDSGNSLSTQDNKYQFQPIVKISPNPSHDLVIITGLSLGDKITITDLLGKTVLNTTAKQEDEVISTASFTAGIYIVSIGENTRFKLIKE